MAYCEYNVTKCTHEAVEQVWAFEAAHIPGLRMRLCSEHSSRWSAILTKRDRQFERKSLITGEVEVHEHEAAFQRTARVGRGVAKK
jgi:hypothetical protein